MRGWGWGAGWGGAEVPPYLMSVTAEVLIHSHTHVYKLPYKDRDWVTRGPGSVLTLTFTNYLTKAEIGSRHIYQQGF